MSNTVLVVERHADLRREIIATLEKSYQCVGVASADDAMLKLREGDYSFVFVDVDDAEAMQPVIHRMEDRQQEHGRLILMSSDAARSTLTTLRKPFDRADLMLCLRP